MSDQLDLLDAAEDDWWEFNRGLSVVRVRADSPSEAREKAQAALRDLGVVPGGPPGLHESFKGMCEFARRGRR
jgi:hypothetical protein